jgi:hypothetical protein
MKRFQMRISDLMLATLMVALFVASMLRPFSLWIVVFQFFLVLAFRALLVGRILHPQD